MQYEAYLGNQAIGLSSYEFSLLWNLASNVGRIFTKEQLYQIVYQDYPVGNVDNSIYCLIRSLRKKLEPDSKKSKYIHNVRGIGYKFQPLPEN